MRVRVGGRPARAAGRPVRARPCGLPPIQSTDRARVARRPPAVSSDPSRPTIRLRPSKAVGRLAVEKSSSLLRWTAPQTVNIRAREAFDVLPWRDSTSSFVYWTVPRPPGAGPRAHIPHLPACRPVSAGYGAGAIGCVVPASVPRAAGRIGAGRCGAASSSRGSADSSSSERHPPSSSNPIARPQPRHCRCYSVRGLRSILSTKFQ